MQGEEILRNTLEESGLDEETFVRAVGESEVALVEDGANNKTKRYSFMRKRFYIKIYDRSTKTGSGQTCMGNAEKREGVFKRRGKFVSDGREQA